MYRLFRLVQSTSKFPTRSGSNCSLLTQVPFKNQLLNSTLPICKFHTSKPRSALPPVVLLVLRPVLRVAAFLAGRNFRKWWRALPKEKREYYWSRIKEKKLKIAGGSVFSGAMAYWFYLSHIEIEPITGRERFSIITPKFLAELSQLEFQEICTEFANQVVPVDHPYYARVKRVTNRLLQANKHLPQIYTKTWTITVLHDPNNINAFVLPNGNIFVFTAMLDLCETDDELGMVLGHEISHSLLGHAGENVSREQLLEGLKLILIVLAWSLLPSDLLSLLGYSVGAGAVNATLRYPYSRLLENEADQVGIQLAAKACFDVRAAPAFWAKMDILHEMKGGELEWLSTHPSNKTRQEKLEQQLPDAIDFRKYCKCPPLPRRDPRQTVETFRQAVSQVRSSSQPVGLIITVPDMETKNSFATCYIFCYMATLDHPYSFLTREDFNFVQTRASVSHNKKLARSSMEPVVVDGSHLEGGGQTLRITCALSAILGIPVRIHSIRAGRSTPGLRPQHLSGLNLIRDVTNGTLEGGSIGSTEIKLTPGKIEGGKYFVDTKTAGSITLIIQAILPCLIFAMKKSVVNLKGGTNVDMAPPIDYLINVFSTITKRSGINFNSKILRRGFYPKGGGEVQLEVEPVKKLSGIVLDKPQEIKRITGVAFVAGTIPMRVANDMCRSATQKINSVLDGVTIQIDQYFEEKAFGNGTAIILAAETADGLVLGGSGLGRQRQPADKVGEEAGSDLVDSCSRKVCLDQYAQDQVIIFMALAEGTSRILIGPLTLHTQTAIHVTSQLTGVTFNVIDMKTQPETFTIECHGLGFTNPSFKTL